MRVLHINQSEASGGAGIAGLRLHDAMLAQGADSYIMAGSIRARTPRVSPVPGARGSDAWLKGLTDFLGLHYIHRLSTFRIAKHEFCKKADILNFHNLHSGYFNYLALPRLTRDRPAVYTLHDMWAFTGHCAYSYDCERWKTGCGSCPYPSTYPAIRRDNTRLEWKLKKTVHGNANLTIVTVSRWLADQARQSLLSRFAVHHIPNGLNTDICRPLDPEKCREVLQIPQGKKTLLFAAADTKDPRKGFDLLLNALCALPASLKKEIVLTVMGDGANQDIAKNTGVETVNLGYVDGDILKSIVFSAADLFVFPTRADNLPVVLQESMACGTPMISFDIGGVSDLVRPGTTGYLAHPEDSQDLSQGIVQLLEDNDARAKMGANCRAIALEEYSSDLQAKRYLDLYRSILNPIGIATVKC